MRLALLATVLAVLFFAQISATILMCRCSDCNNSEFCYGETCYAQIYLDVRTNVVSERWRCLNSTQLALCNITHPTTSFTCCNTHDFCNADMHAYLPGVNQNVTTVNVTTEVSNGTSCTNGSSAVDDNSTLSNTNLTGSDTNLTSSDTNSTVSDKNLTVVCPELLSNGTVNGTAVPINETTPTPEETTPTNTTTIPPFLSPLPPSLTPDPGSVFECRVAETNNPHTFNFSFCETTEACFISLRVRSDKSQIYKWGCSRSTCNEEDRPRKRKVCCTNWFCNGDVPIDWLEGETTPTLTIPSETTPTSNYSQPPTPNITTHTTPPVEESPNCTVAEGNPLHLSPCVGPGSVPDLVPIKTEPVPTSSAGYICYCNTCEDSYICHTQFGCGTTYTQVYDLTVTGGYRVQMNRFCIPDDAYFQRCGVQFNLECCLSTLCNIHNTTKATPTPSGGSVSAPTTEPITAATTTDPSESTTNHNTDHTVTPLTHKPSVTDSVSEQAENRNQKEEEDDIKQDKGEEDDSLLYYVLSGLVTVLVLALILVLCLLSLCCYRYQGRFQKKPTSPLPWRRHPEGVTTRQVGVAQDVSWNPTSELLGSRAAEEGNGREGTYNADYLRMETNSCNTVSTYAQSSTPESTV